METVRRKMSRTEVANEIEAFLEDRLGEWDWDEFISLRLVHPEMDAIRRLCADLPEIDPPIASGHYCGERGMSIMARLVADPRSGLSPLDLGRYTK
jgi:hypothetical protein